MSEEAFVDVLSRHRFVHHGLVYGMPFPDGCAQAIFRSHFFEHITRGDAECLAVEALRVLEPGGVIRIAVPDLAWLVSEYERGASAPSRRHLRLRRARRVRPPPLLYDEEPHGELLAGAGFADVTRCRFREGRAPDLDVLGNREGSLVMEAARPGAGG